MSTGSLPMPWVGALKAVGSQLIVAHHLSAYGPLSDAMHGAVPHLAGFFYDYARMAVQVFLVAGGFLAARALSRDGGPLRESPWPLLARRYLRLAIPYLAAIGLAVACAAIAGRFLDDSSIPEDATFPQLLAHVLLLQDLLDFPSLSAGLWYVAIDFQLFALLLLLLRLARSPAAAWSLVLAMTAASLFFFNRDDRWDEWAPYFFGSYGLGAAAWWISGTRHRAALLAILAASVAIAMTLDFRWRIVVALAVALVLGGAGRDGTVARRLGARPVAFLGRVSFSVFLVHFPICLLANALYVGARLEHPAAALSIVAAAWLASIGVGAGFHHLFESPDAIRRFTDAAGFLYRRLVGARLLRL